MEALGLCLRRAACSGRPRAGDGGKLGREKRQLLALLATGSMHSVASSLTTYLALHNTQGSACSFTLYHGGPALHKVELICRAE